MILDSLLKQAINNFDKKELASIMKFCKSYNTEDNVFSFLSCL